MARKRSQNSVSLFPFLAVLVCTMGALILLLLLTTRRIQKQQNETETVADATQSADALDELVAVELDSPFNLTFADDQKPAAVPNDLAASTPPLTLPDPFADSPFADNSFADSSFDDPPSQAIEPDTQITPEASPNINSLTIPGFNDIADATPSPAEEPKPTNFELQLQIDELAATLDEEKARHQQLLDDIKAAEDRLAASSSEDTQIQMEQLSNLKRQEQVLRSQLEDQQVAISELNQRLENASETTEEAERILHTRESALVSLREITKENTELTTAGRDKTLLEFSNSTGTSQKPIIVDVSKDGFRFRPSNIAISPEQMEGFPKNDNPLLAGIAAAHRHADPGALRSSAYVLLLVRPNGSIPFYAAQRALKNANIHFGYELVGQAQDIATGKLDPDEQDAIRSAVASAMTRQQSLYGGLMAEIQELQSSKRNQTPQQPRLLPDGRIAMPGERGHDTFGQYFAGGERPPESVGIQNRLEIAKRKLEQQNRMQQFAETSEPTRHSDAQANADLAPLPETTQFNPFALTDITGVNADSDTSSTDASPFADNALEDNPFADNSSSTSGSTPIPGLAEQVTQPQPGIGNEWLSALNGGGEPSGSGSADADNGPSSILESMLVSPRQPTDNVQPMQPQMTPEEVRRSEELARLDQLAGNFGLGNFNSQSAGASKQPRAGQAQPAGNVPTGQSSETTFWGEQFSQGASAAGESPPSLPNPVSETQASLIPQDGFTDLPAQIVEPQLPDRINLSWLQQPSESSTPGSNPGSQLTPDWSDSATAPADSTTRTVGAPENPFSVEANGANTGGGQYSEGSGGPAAPQESQTESMISKFLRNVDEELRENRPDPYLLTLLDSANNAEDGQFAGRHYVRVVMDRDQVRVGSSPPFNVRGLSQQQILDATLNALAAEMDAKPAEAGRFALPYVGWQFDDANRQRQAILQQQLQQMDVPTRAATARAKPTEDELETPVLRWPAFDQITPLQNSADPIEVSPPARSSRGLSL